MPKYYAADADIRLVVCNVSSCTTANPTSQSGSTTYSTNIYHSHGALLKGHRLLEHAVPCLGDDGPLHFIGGDEQRPFLFVQINPSDQQKDRPSPLPGFRQPAKGVFRTKSPATSARDRLSYPLPSPSPKLSTDLPAPSSSNVSKTTVLASGTDLNPGLDSEALRTSLRPSHSQGRSVDWQQGERPLKFDSRNETRGQAPSTTDRGSRVSTPHAPQEVPTIHKAIGLSIKLGPKSLKRTDDKETQDLKVDVFVNGEFAATSYLPSRSTSQSLEEGLLLSGTRVERLLERAWLLARPSYAEKTTSTQIACRWADINRALLEEADIRGFDSTGKRPPVGDYLVSLASLPLPQALCNQGLPANRSFGILDVIISLGDGKKYTTSHGYLHGLHRMEDYRYNRKHPTAFHEQKTSPSLFDRRRHEDEALTIPIQTQNLDRNGSEMASDTLQRGPPRTSASTGGKFTAGCQPHSSNRTLPVSRSRSQSHPSTPRHCPSPLGFLDAATSANLSPNASSPSSRTNRSGNAKNTLSREHDTTANTPRPSSHSGAPCAAQAIQQSPKQGVQQTKQPPSAEMPQHSTSSSPTIKLYVPNRTPSHLPHEESSMSMSTPPELKPTRSRSGSSFVVKKVKIVLGSRPSPVVDHTFSRPFRLSKKKASGLSPIHQVARKPHTPSTFGRAELGPPNDVVANQSAAGLSLEPQQTMSQMASRQLSLALSKDHSDRSSTRKASEMQIPDNRGGTRRNVGSPSVTNRNIMPPPTLPHASTLEHSSVPVGGLEREWGPSPLSRGLESAPSRSKAAASNNVSRLGKSAMGKDPRVNISGGSLSKNSRRQSSKFSDPANKRSLAKSRAPSESSQTDTLTPNSNPPPTAALTASKDFVIPRLSYNSTLTFSGKPPTSDGESNCDQAQGAIRQMKTRHQEKKEESEREAEAHRARDRKKGRLSDGARRESLSGDCYGVRQVKTERTGEFRETDVLCGVRFFLNPGAGW